MCSLVKLPLTLEVQFVLTSWPDLLQQWRCRQKTPPSFKSLHTAEHLAINCFSFTAKERTGAPSHKAGAAAKHWTA